jgi:hypothetical protein
MPAVSKSASGESVYDKEGVEIHLGDTVSTKFRGGRHSGRVLDIVHAPQEKEVKGHSVSVKHPPKVLFIDQNGMCDVYH